MKFNRRLFLALPALAPLRALGFESTDEHRFHYDHLIGTSMDLAVWTKSREAAQHASRAALNEIAPHSVVTAVGLYFGQHPYSPERVPA